MKILHSSNILMPAPLKLICLTFQEFWQDYEVFSYKSVEDEVYGPLTYFFTNTTLHACHPVKPQSKFSAFDPTPYDDDLPNFKEIITIGTPFQKAIWQHLLEIPRGQTTTYGQIAKAHGNPKAARAAGQAIGANPVGIHIPCHRVLGANGKLGGFSWGTELKEEWLQKESSDKKPK